MSSKKTTATKEGGKPALVPKLRFPEFRGAEGWAQKRLIDTADRSVKWSFIGGPFGSNLKSSDYVPDGVRIIQLQNIGDGEFFNDYQIFTTPEKADELLSNNIYPGEIIMSKMGDPVGRACLIPKRHDRYVMCSDGIRLVVDEKENDKYFIYSLINAPLFRDVVEKTATGSTRKRIGLDDLKSLPIRLPRKIEQQKIAECLSSVDELMAAQARKVDALKTHKKGLMQQLFPREGETQPRIRFPEFQNAGEWECKTLKDIAKITSGSTPLRSNPEFFAGGTIPWVKTTDLNNSFIDETEEKITPKARARVNPVGSVLIAMYGGFNQIGRTGCLNFPAATNQAISVLVLDRKAAMPAYVLAWLNSKVEDWKRIASSSRKDPNITSSDVAKFTIVLPELPEQERIASCLSSLDALTTAETQKLEALKTHKKGLMQQLFPSPEAVEA